MDYIYIVPFIVVYLVIGVGKYSISDYYGHTPIIYCIYLILWPLTLFLHGIAYILTGKS